MQEQGLVLSRPYLPVRQKYLADLVRSLIKGIIQLRKLTTKQLPSMLLNGKAEEITTHLTRPRVIYPIMMGHYWIDNSSSLVWEQESKNIMRGQSEAIGTVCFSREVSLSLCISYDFPQHESLEALEKVLYISKSSQL